MNNRKIKKKVKEIRENRKQLRLAKDKNEILIIKGKEKKLKEELYELLEK